MSTAIDNDLLDPYIQARSQIRQAFRQLFLNVTVWDIRPCPDDWHPDDD